MIADHGDAGGGGNADGLGIAKDLNEAAHQRRGLPLIAGVVVHLAAAGLVERELDGVPEPLEQTDDRLAGGGEERVVIAGDEERNAQSRGLNSSSHSSVSPRTNPGHDTSLIVRRKAGGEIESLPAGVY